MAPIASALHCHSTGLSLAGDRNIPDDGPYLDHDTVLGVRDDLVMRYVEKPASTFPNGMEISGKVVKPFLSVEFDVTLMRED